MYVTEAMIQSMEEMMRNAADMEKSIKMMMETEARMHGMELDSRHNARDMWAQLMDHMSTAGAQSSMMADVPMPMADSNMHMHDDGMEHSHEGGAEPHTHDAPAMEENTMPPGAPMSEAEQVAEERAEAQAAIAQDHEEPKV